MLLALNNSSTGSFVQFLTVFVLFIIVLLTCAFTTRFVAGYQKSKMMSGNIHVLETLKTFAVGIGKDNVTMLGELNEESLVINESENFEGMDFKSMLEKAKNIKLKK